MCPQVLAITSSRLTGDTTRSPPRFLAGLLQNFSIMFGKSLTTVLLGFLVGFVASQQAQVMVEQGALFGETKTFMENEFINVTKNINVFRGVPFAEPPVGPLRFAAPMMKAGWGEGVWNATYFRDSCIQYNTDTRFDLPTSEDCLYLNIYAPMPAPVRIPSFEVSVRTLRNLITSYLFIRHFVPSYKARHTSY